MTQVFLPLQYEVAKKVGCITALAGLPTNVEFAYAVGLGGIIGEHLMVHRGNQGWIDDKMIMSMVWLNHRPGNCVTRHP